VFESFTVKKRPRPVTAQMWLWSVYCTFYFVLLVFLAMHIDLGASVVIGRSLHLLLFHGSLSGQLLLGFRIRPVIFRSYQLLLYKKVRWP